jgi:hypothetical protein
MRLDTTQTPDLIAAVKTAAKREGVTISGFVRQAILKRLPVAVRKQIKEQRPVGRPKK